MHILTELDTSSTRARVNSNGSRNDTITPCFFKSFSIDDISFLVLYHFSPLHVLSLMAQTKTNPYVFSITPSKRFVQAKYFMILTTQISTWSATGSFTTLFSLISSFSWRLQVRVGSAFAFFLHASLCFLPCLRGWFCTRLKEILLVTISTNETMTLNNFH